MSIRAREISTGRLCSFAQLDVAPSVIVVQFDDTKAIVSHKIDPNKPRFILLEETE